MRKEAESLSLLEVESETEDKPTNISFVNNCIVFKVQDCMYKNTIVLASAPQRKREQKEGTNSGEESEKRKAKYRGERVKSRRDEWTRAINNSRPAGLNPFNTQIPNQSGEIQHPIMTQVFPYRLLEDYRTVRHLSKALTVLQYLLQGKMIKNRFIFHQIP